MIQIVNLKFLFLVFLVLFGGFAFDGSVKSFAVNKENCKEKIESLTVKGVSLSGIIKDEQEINVDYNYYDCREIERGDIVIYTLSGRHDPIIKIVKAVPGDILRLEIAGDNSWNIFVNSEILRNSGSEPYVLNKGGFQMLSLYVNEDGGKIPKDSYLIMGNLATGSLDSTHFGLVSKKDILGKVIYP